MEQKGPLPIIAKRGCTAGDEGNIKSRTCTGTNDVDRFEFGGECSLRPNHPLLIGQTLVQSNRLVYRKEKPVMVN
ncbi:unnamed protein product [Victoria cruziana]